jgi:chitinase
LQELRSTEVGKKLILSAATGLTPFYGSSGSPLTNMSGFAEVLDYIEVMDYDVWGSWSSGVGPNSPLNDTCAPSADQQGSAVSAVASWTKAGMPKEKIVLGVASYGHSFYVTDTDAFVHDSKTKLAAYPAFNASLQPAGDAWDDPAGYDVCGNWEPRGGNFDFWGLIEEGYLDCKGNPEEGIDYRFDSCSQTVWLPRCLPFVLTFSDHLFNLGIRLQFHFKRHDFL